MTKSRSIFTLFMAGVSFCVCMTAAAQTAVVTQSSLLAWAEREYPEYFGGGGVDSVYSGYPVRYYPSSGNYIGFVGEDVYVLGPITEDEPLRVGTLASFVCQVYPDCGVSTPIGSSRYVTQGGIHELLKGWGTGQTVNGKVLIYNHNADGSIGALFQRTTDSCTAQIESDGGISYTSGGQTIHYRYEDTAETVSTATIGVKLYPNDSATGTAATNAYIELTKDSGYYRVVTNGAALEQVCAGPSVYDAAGRFPSIDGRLAGSAGTWRGRVADQPESSFMATTARPSYARLDASCDVVINSAGQATVTIDGVTLPVFYTTDLLMDQKSMRTMFSNNPQINPKTTYALQYGSSGFNGAFTVYVPPMTYIDSANISFNSDWTIACVTTRQ